MSANILITHARQFGEIFARYGLPNIMRILNNVTRKADEERFIRECVQVLPSLKEVQNHHASCLHRMCIFYTNPEYCCIDVSFDIYTTMPYINTILETKAIYSLLTTIKDNKLMVQPVSYKCNGVADLIYDTHTHKAKYNRIQYYVDVASLVRIYQRRQILPDPTAAVLNHFNKIVEMLSQSPFTILHLDVYLHFNAMMLGMDTSNPPRQDILEMDIAIEELDVKYQIAKPTSPSKLQLIQDIRHKICLLA